MKLLVLRYHRARTGLHGNDPAMLDAHFAHIAAHYPPVLPGEPLAEGQLNVCLTFDDAYYDFYAIVLPLLRRHGLRAVLGVPASFVRDGTGLDPAARLAVGSDEAFLFPERGGFCTAEEIEELIASGHVQLAAQGMTHVRIDHPYANFPLEIETPQFVLQSRFHRKVESFIFPFGRFSEAAVDAARQHYRYIFRIGGALNGHWDAGLLYRVDGDCLESPTAPFTPGNLLRYRARALWNRLRAR